MEPGAPPSPRCHRAARRGDIRLFSMASGTVITQEPFYDKEGGTCGCFSAA